jgi:hypothetical protein
MILLSPGSFAAGLFVIFAAILLGGWDTLPIWMWLIVICIAVMATNGATWYAVDTLRMKKSTVQEP